MIREGQGRSRPCVVPRAGSRTKGDRAWQHLGESKAVCGGRRSRRLTAPRAAGAGPAGTAWCAPAAVSRSLLASSPAGGSALQRTPGGGGGSPRTRLARLLPRALSPFRPPQAGTERRAAKTAAESRPRARLGSPTPPGSPASNARREAPPRPLPLRWGSAGGPPRHALHASPPTAPRAWRPPAPPGAGCRGAPANLRPGRDGGGANANLALRSGAGNPRWKSLLRGLPAPAGWGSPSYMQPCGLWTLVSGAPTRSLCCQPTLPELSV